MSLTNNVTITILRQVMWWEVVVLSAVLRLGAGQWWSNAVYYRVLVDSFKDSDGDGLGDLRGAAKQISYVRAIGSDAIILSPISARSEECSEPGVVDLVEVDKRFGGLDALASLLEKAKKLELKVVVTVPIQTTSTASEWFKSSADRVTGFEDRFLWRDGTVEEPPPPEDNIEWKWNKNRGAYWASFNNEALLNFCSESTAAVLSAAQCAWLRRGVDGVLLNPDFTDVGCGEKLVKQLAADAVSCARSTGLVDPPVIIAESSLDVETAARYYGDGGVGASSIVSEALTSTSRKTAAELGLGFHAALLTAPEGAAPVWSTSARNGSRIATRYGSDMVDAINLLSLILPGATILQQGDELGTADTLLEWATSTKCWPNAPSHSSAPFPWDDTSNAGFTSGDPWLPLAPNFRYKNAKTEYANDMSHLGVVRVAAAMRKTPAIGPHVEIRRLNGALAVLRWGGSGSLVVVCNAGREPTEVQLSRMFGLPAEMTVAASSAGSALSAGSHLPLERTLKLAGGEGVLLAGGPRHCGGPGPVDKIANKLSEGWQKINKYFSNI